MNHSTVELNGGIKQNAVHGTSKLCNRSCYGISMMQMASGHYDKETKNVHMLFKL